MRNLISKNTIPACFIFLSEVILSSAVHSFTEHGTAQHSKINSSGSESASTDQQIHLVADFYSSKIWNPGTGHYDFVRLRGLRDEKQSKTSISPPMAPIIQISPGSNLSLKVTNNLPQTADCVSHPEDINKPHCFNGTNLHTHGLWISPSDNSDNVLIDIKPGTSFNYRYEISQDHPSGTFWYHPHRHGATALQVASGMSGPLIVRGDRQPTGTKTGDIDVLLKPIANQGFKEKILHLQQIPYACSENDNNVLFSWKCDPGDLGFVESYQQIDPPKPKTPLLYRHEDGTVNPTWSQSGRYTSVNGNIHPVISTTKVGEIERWRVIHAGNDDTVSIEFRKLRDNSSESQFRVSANSLSNRILSDCDGPRVAHYQMAVDGLTSGSVSEKQVSVLHPGNRTDFLVTLPEAGTWCVVDTASPSGGTIQGSRSDHQLLGFVKVTGDSRMVNVQPKMWIKNELIRAAQSNINQSMRASVVNDLESNMALTAFVPHRSIDASEVTSVAKPLQFQLKPRTSEAPLFMVDGHPYDPNRIDRRLKLGTTEEWELSSDFVSHPFHIHVNPFQIVAVEVNYDGNWIDVSAPDSIDDFQVVDGKLARGGPIDPQYRGTKGQWMDTVFVKNIAKKPGPNSSDFSYRVTIRTRYNKYTGQFVLHCHTLDHEDQGMMQNVVIEP